MDYETFNQTIEDTINKLGVADSGKWNEKVKRVAVIMSASRSGSSLLKEVLSRSLDVAYLSGEEEPWFLLTKNTFPYINSILNEINEKQRLLDYLYADLGVNTQEIDLERLKQLWKKRILIQFPHISNTEQDRISGLVDELYQVEIDYKHQTKNFLKTLFGKKAGYYDLLHDDATPFKEEVIIEQPPFIIPSQTKTLTNNDIGNKVFMFKSPQSSYRIGVWEELFPNAEIKYIHLIRGFAQTVNSMMDGWQYPAGFYSYDLYLKNSRLNIEGYDDIRWWNFDLPPNWEQTLNLPLEQVCLNQWYQANNHILGSTGQRLTIKFEDFLENPNEILNEIASYVGISPQSVGCLPHVMTVEDPISYRWHKRKKLLLEMTNDLRAKEMMDRLHYPMNPNEWS